MTWEKFLLMQRFCSCRKTLERRSDSRQPASAQRKVKSQHKILGLDIEIGRIEFSFTDAFVATLDDGTLFVHSIPDNKTDQAEQKAAQIIGQKVRMKQ